MPQNATRAARSTSSPSSRDLNPSVEHFARILWEFITARIPTDSLTALAVRVWEDDEAWASYRREFSA